MRLLFNFVFSCGLATISHAEEIPYHPADNVFFGFEFVLEPVAMKWTCGGDAHQDIKRVREVMRAFPEHSERAQLAEALDFLETKLTRKQLSLSDFLTEEMAATFEAEICAAALPLNLAWLQPESLANDVDLRPADQVAAWTNFWEVIENIHIAIN